MLNSSLTHIVFTYQNKQGLNNMSVKVGIIGIGQQGSVYATALKNNSFYGQQLENKIEGLELTAICDISEERREWAKKELGDVAIFADYVEMMDSGLVDAVFVVVPHYLHPGMSIDAMKQIGRASCRERV